MTRAAHFDEKEGLRPSLSYSVTLAASKNLINLINSSWSLAFHRHSSHPCTFREYYNLLVPFYSSKPFFINCFTISIFLKPIHHKARMTKRSNSSGILLLSQERFSGECGKSQTNVNKTIDKDKREYHKNPVRTPRINKLSAGRAGTRK